MAHISNLVNEIFYYLKIKNLSKNWEHVFLGENVILNTSGILHIPQNP